MAVLSFLIGMLVGTRMPAEQPAPSSAAAPATSPSPSTAPNTLPSPETGTVHRREAGDPMALGDVDAPVVIAVFSDLGCPIARSGTPSPCRS